IGWFQVAKEEWRRLPMKIGQRFADAHAPLCGLSPIDLSLIVKRLFEGSAGDEVHGQVERPTVHRLCPVGMYFRDAGMFESEQGAHLPPEPAHRLLLVGKGLELVVQEFFNRERGTGGVQDILSTVNSTECASAQLLCYAITGIQDRARR